MGDLFFDDIEDRAYTDEMILADVEALVKSGQRESTIIDYKSEVSEQDNWPQTVAAFSNSFGGLIIFGVEGSGDQPRRISGFDPKGVEIKTKLASMVIDRIQPRPDFSVRVATLDKKTGTEIALLRISEGRTPPYMHSKGHEHRVYTRIGAQKAEADYLQLVSLFEKRQRLTSRNGRTATVHFGSDSQFLVPRPAGSNQVSPHVFHFIANPRNEDIPLRLGREAERLFARSINDVLGERQMPIIRSRDATVFRISRNGYQEQRFAVSSSGATGFISYPGVVTQDGLMFVPLHFCVFLLDFLSISSLFYERAVRYYGSLKLEVMLSIPGGASLFDGLPEPPNFIGGAYLFDPPLNRVTQNMRSEIEVSLHPPLADRLEEYLEDVLNELARRHGSVLVSEFGRSVKKPIEDALSRLRTAHVINRG